MSARRASRTGLVLCAGLSFLVMVGGVFVARPTRGPSRAPVGRAAKPAPEATPPEAPSAPIAPPNEASPRFGTAARDGNSALEAMVERLVHLLTRDPADADEDEIAHIAGALVREG